MQLACEVSLTRRVFEGALLQLGKRSLSRDDLVMLLQESAAIVNNTPLWAVSNDPSNPLPLASSTLLTLREHPHNSPVDTFTEADLDAYGPRRYRKIQYLAEQFWTRWRSEHLNQLTLRRKWQHPVRCFAKGDVVMVRNPLAPRNNWETGVITTVISSPDKLIRSVELSLPSTSGCGNRRTAVRGIHSLVLLAPSAVSRSQ